MADSLTVLLFERLGGVINCNAVTQFYLLEHAAHYVVNKNKNVLLRYLINNFSVNIIGGAILVHPDSSALAELVQSWEEVNHLYVVENFLRHLLSNEEASKCELTATLTNSGNFSVILSAASATDHTVCLNAGKNLVQVINKKSSSTQDAMLRPVAMTAALMNPFNPEATVKGFLLNTQNRMMSKASDLRDHAAGKANDALVEADRHVKEKQYSMANKAFGQSVSLLVRVCKYACAIACAVAMTVA